MRATSQQINRPTLWPDKKNPAALQKSHRLHRRNPNADRPGIVLNFRGAQFHWPPSSSSNRAMLTAMRPGLSSPHAPHPPPHVPLARVHPTRTARRSAGPYEDLAANSRRSERCASRPELRFLRGRSSLGNLGSRSIQQIDRGWLHRRCAQAGVVRKLIRTFDPAAEETVFFPRLQGG
jgi:hypothetical protein